MTHATVATAYRLAATSARRLAQQYPDHADYHNRRAETYERSAAAETKGASK